MRRCPVCNKWVIVIIGAIEVPVLARAFVNQDGVNEMEFGFNCFFHRYCYFRVKGILMKQRKASDG